MIKCKRVYESPAKEDGYRVLVDRLWPRGVKKTDLQYDEWCKTLAPSTELRKAFHGEAIDFSAFRESYRQELEAQKEEGKKLAARGAKSAITLLYAAKDTEHNHALILAEWLRALA